MMYALNDIADEKHLREEMALKFLACIIRPLNPSFAGLILELCCEFAAGETQTSQLVQLQSYPGHAFPIYCVFADSSILKNSREASP